MAKGYGSTKQDAHGDADLYKEASDKTNSGEHSETAADEDVGDYYRELSARRAPNYDRNANLQVKQAPHELSPADGGEGYVGSNTGPAMGLEMIQGKKGYSEDMPIWEEKSSFTDYPDNSGSTDKGGTDLSHGEDSRDEFAPWKKTRDHDGMVITNRDSVGAGDAGPDKQVEADPGGHPDTLPTASAESGNHDWEMPVTEFTTNDGGGAPRFKFSGHEQAEAQYRPKPRD